MKPKFFGQYLVEKGYIAENELYEALKYQQTEDAERVGDVAVNKDYMTLEQVSSVNLEQRRTDEYFGKLAVNMGFLTDYQLERVITIQKHHHIYLGQALINLSILNKEQMAVYLDEFHKEQKPIEILEKVIPEGLDVNDEVFSLLDICVKIFRRMVNLPLKVGPGYSEPTGIKNTYLISVISFIGTTDMKFFMNLPENIGVKIVQNLYKDETMVCNEATICDCIGEVTNVVCGNASSLFLELGLNVTISPPEKFLKKNTPVLESKAGRNILVFPCTVPIGNMEIGMIYSSQDELNELAKKKDEYSVLIVDDSELICRELNDIVNSISGFSVSGIALNGAQAIEKFQSQKPDIILMDLILPDIPGEEVIRKIKQLDESVKIIVVSSIGGSPNEILKEYTDGVITSISKPIDPESIKNAILKAVS